MSQASPGIAAVTSLCLDLRETFHEMSKAVGMVRDKFRKLPFVIRPIAERDFRSEMGFEVAEWEEFLQRLASRLGKIAEAAKAASDGTGPKSTLSEAVTPFLDRAELAVEKIKTFQRYTAQSPAKLKNVPKMLISDEDRAQIEEASEYAPAIGEAADKLSMLAAQLGRLLAGGA